MKSPETVSSELLNAALAYAGNGFPVFACDPATKRPFPGSHGFKDATTDAATIQGWWDKHPDAMVAMPTGDAIGAWVLDIDDPATFEAACPIPMPETRRCATGKGYHLYFGFDPAQEVRNAQVKMIDGERRWPFEELPGAEVRGNGGYVIVPPSLHPSGREYSWAVEGDPAKPPAELLRIVRKIGDPQPAAPIASSRPQSAQGRQGDTPWGLAALDGECAAIRAAGNGAQEGTLNDAALKIGAIVAGKQLTIDTAKGQLISAGLAMPSYNPRDRWTPDAVIAKIERGLADGARNPRAPEERTISREHSDARSGQHETIDPETGEVIYGSAEDEGYSWEQNGQEQPSAEDDPVPIDLWARYEAPPLPLGLMPADIEQFAVRHGEVMGVEPVGLAMAALTVCSAAIPDQIELQVKRHDPTWRESARLWVGLIGTPSTKKSPIMKAAVKPLARIDGGLMRAYMVAKGEYDALPTKEQKLTSRPVMKRHLVSDATIESLQEVLKGSTTGVLSEQDELSGWFGQMDKYTPGRGAQADRAFWLKAFNGGRYTLDRVARGSCQIPNLSISLLGGIQPDPLRRITNDSVDDGLIQRLLPVILPPATIGKDVPAGTVVLDYERLIEKLVLLKAPLRAGVPSLDEYERPQPLRFSDAARTVRERLEREHQDLTKALEGTSPKLASHFGKYDGIFARLCVLWHCIENCDGGTPPVEISDRTALRVAEFMETFIRPSAIAFYAGMLGLSDGHDLLQGLAAYILAEGLTEVNARVVQRSTRTLRAFTADEARQLCEKLEAFGWLQPLAPTARSNSARWRVVPAVHAMFEEKGRQDAERRKDALNALQSALGS